MNTAQSVVSTITYLLRVACNTGGVFTMNTPNDEVRS